MGCAEFGKREERMLNGLGLILGPEELYWAGLF